MGIAQELASQRTHVNDDPARQLARRRVSRRGPAALLAMLTPAVLFPVLLFAVKGQPRFAWLDDPAAYPWELWLLAVCGSAATGGGVLDWAFHRSGETAVGHAAHRRVAGSGGGERLLVVAWHHLHEPRQERIPFAQHACRDR